MHEVLIDSRRRSMVATFSGASGAVPRAGEKVFFTHEESAKVGTVSGVEWHFADGQAVAHVLLDPDSVRDPVAAGHSEGT
ncbi:MAG: hypothetical protein SangKO_086760 [Sandaracinaceae bacterium]